MRCVCYAKPHTLDDRLNPKRVGKFGKSLDISDDNNKNAYGRKFGMVIRSLIGISTDSIFFRILCDRMHTVI